MITQELHEAIKHAEVVAERENLSVAAVILAMHPEHADEYLDLEPHERIRRQGAGPILPAWVRDLAADNDHYPGPIHDPDQIW